jgi:hypothetical protein
MSSGATAYAFAADVAESRAQVAARVASDPARFAPNAETNVAFYRELSRTWRRRAELHGERAGRAERLRTLGDMMRRLDYRGRNSGGLGVKSFLKDSFAVLRGPKSP